MVRVSRVDPHAVIENDHAKLGLQLDATRWVVAKADGAVIVFDLATRPLFKLPTAIRGATSYELTGTKPGSSPAPATNGVR